ncbi:MAG: dipeptidyl-peptidase 4, partial [Acidobacteriota bacterium]|nr:dipeptidyl-peptidase 4 [Acidobacteriota bacterium]
MTASRLLRPALAACLLAAMPMEGSAASGPPAKPVPLSMDAIFSPGGNGHLASQLAWSPDGTHLTYVWKDEQTATGTALWSLDTATAKAEPLFHTNDFKGRWKDKETFALADYFWSPRGDALLVSTGDDLFLYSLGGRELSRLTETQEGRPAPEDPKLSPQGDRVAFVRDADLHVLDLASRHEIALTKGGKKDVTQNGIVDWVYGEEIWNRAPTAYWWSPDGKRIAYVQFDESPVEVYPIVDYSPKYPKILWQKYPKAGEPNPRVRIGVVDTAGGETTWMTTGDEEGYLARVAWTPDSRELRIQRLNRDQTRLDLLRCMPTDGRCTPLLTEEHPTWVNVHNDFRPLPDGRFLWSSEKSGWRRLYLHDAEGREVRALTPEGWALDSLLALTEDGRAVVSGYSTGPLGATDRQVLRVRIDGDARGQVDTQVEKLATAAGTNVAVVSEKSGWFALTWGDGDHPNVTTLRRPDGSEAATLPGAPPLYD